MDRDTVPDEHEQEAAYRAAAEALDGRPLLVRTLDAGADKPVPSSAQPHEANPFLGVRGIRLGLARPELLGPAPRVAPRGRRSPGPRHVPHGRDDRGARRGTRSLDRAREEIGLDAAMEIGIMVEVPSAALTAAALAGGSTSSRSARTT